MQLPASIFPAVKVFPFCLVEIHGQAVECEEQYSESVFKLSLSSNDCHMHMRRDHYEKRRASPCRISSKRIMSFVTLKINFMNFDGGERQELEHVKRYHIEKGFRAFRPFHSILGIQGGDGTS